jgi:hypothetical protein
VFKPARTFFLAFALSSAALAPAVAQTPNVSQTIDTVLGDHTKYQAMIAALQAGVKNKDTAAVAALVSYPITVKIHGKKTRIKTAADFATNYDAIITPAIAAVIENQKYDDLMVNAQGIMFGKGEVWINGICKDTACSQSDVKVVTIQAGAS